MTLARYASFVERPSEKSHRMALFGYRHSQNPQTEYGPYVAHVLRSVLASYFALLYLYCCAM